MKSNFNFKRQNQFFCKNQTSTSTKNQKIKVQKSEKIKSLFTKVRKIKRIKKHIKINKQKDELCARQMCGQVFMFCLKIAFREALCAVAVPTKKRSVLHF